MNTKEIEEVIEKILEAVFGKDASDPDWTEKSNVVSRIKPIISTLRQSVLEEVRERLPKKDTTPDADELERGDRQGWNAYHDQVTSLINNLIEEKK